MNYAFFLGQYFSPFSLLRNLIIHLYVNVLKKFAETIETIEVTAH